MERGFKEGDLIEEGSQFQGFKYIASSNRGRGGGLLEKGLIRKEAY